MLRRFSRIEKLMGNRFELTAVHYDEQEALAAINQGITEIKRIEGLLTTFNDHSETARINAAAGQSAVKVSEETYRLIERSIRISDLTQGAFDITYGSIDRRFWNFDLNMKELPSREEARKAVTLVNYKNIRLHPESFSVELLKKGMRIGFGGIGKGYAAERAKQAMQQAGIKGGVINASGDLCTWGHQPDGSEWTIGIAAPGQDRHPFASMKISNMGVATSGNYEKFVTFNGSRYSHTIDPRTGWPVSGISSVTIICPHAELADALATPVMVMGLGTGLDMINQMKGIACVIIDEDQKVYTSNNIRTHV